jgi:hypothetical protein
MVTTYHSAEVRGANLFGKTGDGPVMTTFIDYTLIYLLGIPMLLAGWNGGGTRLLALLQCLNGIWLIHRTWALSVNLALDYKRSI